MIFLYTHLSQRGTMNSSFRQLLFSLVITIQTVKISKKPLPNQIIRNQYPIQLTLTVCFQRPAAVHRCSCGLHAHVVIKSYYWTSHGDRCQIFLYSLPSRVVPTSPSDHRYIPHSVSLGECTIKSRMMGLFPNLFISI